jgi:hypothetical protein
MRITNAREYGLITAFLVFALGACGMEGVDGEEGLDGLEEESVAQVEAELTSVSISNAGFESDWSGWTRVGATGLSGVAHGGNQAGKVSPTTGLIKRKVTGLKPSTKYTLSAWFKGHARLGARYYAGSSSKSSRSIDTSSWKQLTVTFTTGPSTTSAEIYTQWVGGGDARIDDFKLTTEGSTSTTTSTTSTSGSCPYPSQLLDVSSWKLQIPTGSPTLEVKNPTLATYAHSTYFKNDSSCAAVRFRAPTNGTTTSGSQYPRSELREMKGSEQMRWSTTSGTHRMRIDQAVLRLPNGKRHIGVGQIHNTDNDIMIVRVEGSELLLKPNGKSRVLLDSSYQLGERFTIEFVASGGVIKVYYNGNHVYSQSKRTSTAYFKAGAYVQSNCDTEADYGATCGSSNYGEVAIYDLLVTHN